MTPGSRGSKRLLVNADDFGWSGSVNRGIAEAHTRGIVTSASILAGGSAFEDAVALARANPDLAIGVHLNIYRGWPVLPPSRVATLLGAEGRFPGAWRDTVWRLATGKAAPAEIEAELRAAVERVLAAGITPRHLDSEKHLHMWPSVFRIVCRIAADYGIPRVRLVREPPGARLVVLGLDALGSMDARVAGNAGVVTAGQTIGVARQALDLVSLERVLAGASASTVEFVCHPGYVDDEFRRLQEIVPNHLECSREQELAALMDPRARSIVEAHGYELCSDLAPVAG